MKQIYLILGVILFIIIMTLLICSKLKSEGYQPSYSGDDVMMYSLFPYLSIPELIRFGNSSRYNYNLIRRFLQRHNIPFSLRDLDSFIYLKGRNLNDFQTIFNAIEPNSAFLTQLRGEEYLLLDKRVLPYKIRKADGSEMNITQPFQIFINILDEEDSEGEKNILGGITFAERRDLNFLIDAVRDIPTERDFNTTFTTKIGKKGESFNLYIMNINYPLTWDESILEEEMEVDEVLDISTAREEEKIINVYTGDDILSQLFKERNEVNS